MAVLETPVDLRAEVAGMQDDWDLIDALLGGTCAMRAQGRKYLPQFPAEKNVYYDDRLARSTLFNGFRRTVETMSGKPFSEDIKLGDDVPPEIVTYAENIDLEGRNLHAFSHEVFWTAMAYGLSHILVDYPESPQAITVAQQKASGVRPYFVHIKPRQILGWRSERIVGAETLTQLRILESVSEDTGMWGVTTVPQVRVLYRDHFEIYRKNDKSVWVLVDENAVSLGRIPLATVYTGRTGFMTACPPLEDLASLNVEHWQKASDLSQILHVASVPILFGAGFAPEGEEGTGKLVIGSSTMTTNEQVDAKLMYVEHSGEAIGAGRQELQDIEDRMRVLGANLLVRSTGGNRTTATEKSIDSAEADSALSLAALNLQDSLGEALQYMAEWEKRPKGGSVVVYRDFDDVVNDTMRGDALMKARDSKNGPVVSKQTTFEGLKHIGALPDTLSWEMEQERIAAEGPLPGADAGGGTTINLAAPANPKTNITRRADGSLVSSNGTVITKTETGYAIQHGAAS